MNNGASRHVARSGAVPFEKPRPSHLFKSFDRESNAAEANAWVKVDQNLDPSALSFNV